MFKGITQYFIIGAMQMIFSDFHIHSELSFDSDEPMAEICRIAQARRLTEICFTEHHDLHEGGGNLDLDRYILSIQEIRDRFPQMRIRAGIELGYDPKAHMRMLNDISYLKPDYVLLAVHAVNGLDPFFADTYYQNRTRKEGIEDYLRAVIEAAELVDDFDAMAHVGYAARYAPGGEEPSPLSYGDAPGLIDTIFDCLIRKGKALEVNTGQDMPIPGPDLLLRYREMGGTLIILGSDAHQAKNIVKNFKETTELLLKLGFTTHCTYQGRKQTLHPLALG